MCEFLSALVLESGEVLTHPILDSHSDLALRYNIRDDDGVQRFAKVELLPDNWLDVDTWRFTLDEQSAPVWWDAVKDQAETKLRTKARNMILTSGTHALIADGVWILGGDVIVEHMVGGRIMAMQDSSQVGAMLGSSQVGAMWDSSQVREMRDSSQVLRRPAEREQ